MGFPVREVLLLCVCAVISSCFGKIAFDWSDQSVSTLFTQLIFNNTNTTIIFILLWCTRIICILIVVTSNTYMFNLYINSMKTRTALQATAINFACNFCTSALAGHFFFGELLPLQWWAGAVLMGTGTYLLGDNKKTHYKIN
eukprot:GHVR01183240.1.p1 GENE.GHVR01183240.1~~GHVR01183240.1.p1  ORF type:complete len:154 (+),score=26.31 GHVR01183240.1:38-463(+)